MNLRIFDRNTLLIITSGGIAAFLLIFILPKDTFVVWLLYRCMYVADTMFHECGHAIFDWIFGMPALPSIFTVFGSDRAGGVTLAHDRVWFMQWVSFVVLAWGCYWVKDNYPSLFWVAIIAALTLTGIAFTKYYRIVELYMGHGGSIFVGACFLYRAWKYWYERNAFQRWADAFLGFYLVLNNMHLAWKLSTSALYREEYATPSFGDNDFVQMTDIVWRWSVQGIGEFTLAYCALALVVPIFLACYEQKEEYVD